MPWSCFAVVLAPAGASCASSSSRERLPLCGEAVPDVAMMASVRLTDDAWVSGVERVQLFDVAVEDYFEMSAFGETDMEIALVGLSRNSDKCSVSWMDFSSA